MYYCSLKMAVSTPKNLLYKIARAYYEDGETQKQIGKRFGLSRVKVCRLLRQARELKIVQISFMPTEGTNADIEHQIAAKFGIDEVITTTPLSYTRQAITTAIGAAAVSYLFRFLQGHESIAITWGSTLLSLVKSLPARSFPRLRIIQSLGGLSQPNADVNGADIVRRMAQLLDAKPIMLFAPGFVGSKAVCDALLSDVQISSVLDLAAKANIAMVGLGTPKPGSVLLSQTIFTEDEIQRLINKGAVGDISLRFFNAQGEAIQDEINDRVIGLSLSQIKKIPRVIGIAGGTEKLPAIRASLMAKLIHVLITDVQTAKNLLKE